MSTAIEYLVVAGQVVGNPEVGFTTEHHQHDRHPTLARARSAGISYFGHDDFNIAYVQGDVLVRWTWMGEDTEPPTVGAELALMASKLGMEVSS